MSDSATMKHALSFLVLLLWALFSACCSVAPIHSNEVVYLAPDLDMPYWRYMAKGVESEAKKGGHSFRAMSSNHSAAAQLQNAEEVIARGVAGIVLSPTDSSTAPSVLQRAEKAHIPVVVADVGTNSGECVCFVTTDNRDGAYQVGQALVEALKQKGGGTVGVVSLSLARNNGKLRTEGFQQALAEGHIKEAGLVEMHNYTADETAAFTKDMLAANPGMRGMFVQEDAPTLGAVRAIRAAGRGGDFLLASFDGTPETLDCLRKGEILISGMQQPGLMGVRAAEALIAHLQGKKVDRQIFVPILLVTAQSLDEQLPTIRKHVFANEAR